MYTVGFKICITFTIDCCCLLNWVSIFLDQISGTLKNRKIEYVFIRHLWFLKMKPSLSISIYLAQDFWLFNISKYAIKDKTLDILIFKFFIKQLNSKTTCTVKVLLHSARSGFIPAVQGKVHISTETQGILTLLYACILPY
jgi:hypothetical protein